MPWECPACKGINGDPVTKCSCGNSWKCPSCGTITGGSIGKCNCGYIEQQNPPMVPSRRRFWGGFAVGVVVVVLLGMFRLPVIAQLAGGFVAAAIAGGLGRGAAVGYMSAFVGTFIDAVLSGFTGQLYKTGMHAFEVSQTAAGFSALLGTIMACVGISFAGLFAGLIGGPLGSRFWPKAGVASTTQDQKKPLDSNLPQQS